MEIRDATEGDLPGLAALYRHLDPGDAPCPPEVAAEALRRLGGLPGSAVLVGEADGALVASCTLVVIPNLTRGGAPYGLIENVVTHGAHRGRGHGTRLLRAAVARGWAAGCYKVMLLTGATEPGVLAFYAAAGFEQTKTGFQVRRIPARADAPG